MHLALDEESEQLRSAVRSFAKDRVRGKSRDWDEAGAVPAKALDEGYGLGLLAAGVPAAFGGAGEGDATPRALTGVVALEELAWGDLSYALRVTAPNHLAVPIALYGTDAQKKELLPALCGASLAPATAAWIEPARAFDLASLRTRAESVAGADVLHGTKTFVPGGAGAMLPLRAEARANVGGEPTKHAVVYARSAPSSGWDAVQAWLVESPSFSSSREDAIGLRGAPLHRLELSTTPGTRIGGARGIDYRRLSARALIASAAAAVGVSRAACEYAAAYAKERVAFGRPIAQYQSIAFMIADAATDVEAARWMTWKAASKIDRGEDGLREAGLAFRFATDSAFRIADHGVQILGGHGVIRDHLAELFFRNARTLAATPGLFIV